MTTPQGGFSVIYFGRWICRLFSEVNQEIKDGKVLILIRIGWNIMEKILLKVDAV